MVEEEEDSGLVKQAEGNTEDRELLLLPPPQQPLEWVRCPGLCPLPPPPLCL